MLKLTSAILASACALGVTITPTLAQVRNDQVRYQQVRNDQARNDPAAPLRVAYADRPAMGGGFIEFIFGGGGAGPAPAYPDAPRYERAPRYELVPQGGQPDGDQRYYVPDDQDQDYYQRQALEPGRPGFDPKYEKQVVEYPGREAPGTIVIDTPNKFLYLVQGGGRALRYGIGVGKPGFTWSGIKHVSAKREWPDWTPPAEMLKRRPDLPRHMEGGPENPLGARAMYLGSTLYRIHGSNEPWTIGTNVSSGCIRMRNEDVIDLYGRVPVGTRVVVL